MSTIHFKSFWDVLAMITAVLAVGLSVYARWRTRKSGSSNPYRITGLWGRSTRIALLFIAFLFLIFALLQLNDVDPVRWVFIYGMVSIMAVLTYFQLLGKKVFTILFILLLIELIWLLPGFVEWILIGMPAITGSMQTSEPQVEYTREFLGLVIALGSLWYLRLRNQDVQ